MNTQFYVDAVNVIFGLAAIMLILALPSEPFGAIIFLCVVAFVWGNFLEIARGR